jgi:hypothetical protein
MTTRKNTTAKPRRTKIEWEYTNAAHTRAIIRERYVDSGQTKRIVCKLDANDTESLMYQIEGAIASIGQLELVKAVTV